MGAVTIPILPGADLSVTAGFWSSLGFEETGRWPGPDEARAAHAAWAGVPVAEPARLSEPQEEPWGAVEFHVVDPHGNLVRLGGFPPGR